jgi:hypothetical protein
MLGELECLGDGEAPFFQVIEPVTLIVLHHGIRVERWTMWREVHGEAE